MPKKNILSMLAGGDRRSIGRSDAVAEIVSNNNRLFPKLMRGMWSEDRLVRMRAADVVEKVTRDRGALLQRYKKELLGLMAESGEQEMRWHLAAMVPRLSLTTVERERAVSLLNGYLEDKSSIVKTFALQGLFELAREEKSIRADVIETLREAVRGGTAAMKARARKLVGELEKINAQSRKAVPLEP